MGVGYADETKKEPNGRKRCMHSPHPHYNVVRGRQRDRVPKKAQEIARDSLKDV